MTTRSTGVAAGRGHRRFAAFWDWVVRHEGREQRALRHEIVSKASGRVLELGVGVGANWRHLPADVEYVGIEPDEYMRERARKHGAEAGKEMELRSGIAEDLPFEDSSFDTVLVTLTLCSVSDPKKALSEALRVLKPGGQLLFMEHVRPEGRFKGRVMDAITPLWRRAAAGCHPNRRTLDSIKRAGFEVAESRQPGIKGLPHVMGIARKPGG